TEEVQQFFDRVFIGYAEDEIAKTLGKRVPKDELIHPPIVFYTSFNNIKIVRQGVLFTNRGCNHRCNFCQTPSFCPKPYKIPLESIEKVLRYYKKIGVTELIILDESFGLFRSHSEKVIDLLDKYNFYWMPLVRPDILNKSLEEWSKKGLIGVLTSIESFNQKTLDSIEKREKIEETVSVIKKLKRMNKFIDGAYMLGFENDTVSSLKKDLKKVAQLKMDITQLCIVTPLPQTPQWNQIEEKYGIFDKDWHHYDAKHLVWNHPNISPEKMREILHWGFKIINPKTKLLETSKGFLDRYIEKKGLKKGIGYMIRNFIQANAFNYTPKEMRLLPHR
ncbi:MAG: radical SAM protein, partial [Candidatus Thermoplasmatota archaeon]